MDEIKEKHPEAYEWLLDKPPHQWSRSHFSIRPKCDVLLNNLCESFNIFILDTRDKPILSMLENIRCKLMKKFYMKRFVAEKYEGLICFRIRINWIIIKSMQDDIFHYLQQESVFN
ncbi:hypothetical protein PTKIN_Ptkin12aG0128400 [Pterospermum kingtungense]